MKHRRIYSFMLEAIKYSKKNNEEIVSFPEDERNVNLLISERASIFTDQVKGTEMVFDKVGKEIWKN
ncbi:MAG: hypothetical protein QW575_08475 [Thermoproteota archaeon]